jgi:hypothetical protein
MTEEKAGQEEIQADGDLEEKANEGASFEDGEELSAPEQTTDGNQGGKPTDENQVKDGEQPESDGDKKPDDKEEKKLFDQEAANKAFIENKKKVRAAEEAAKEAKAKADELAAKLAKYEEGKRPEVPDMPDQFDDDFEEKVKARDEAIIKANEWDNQQKIAEQAKLDKQQEALKKQTEEREAILDTYNDRLKTFGLDEKEMVAKENVVDAYIKDPGLVRFLLSHEDGPLTIAYLSENPREMEKIAGMDTANAAVYVSMNILPNAQKMKPEITKAPPPLDIPEGKGAKEGEDPALEGAVFE